MPIDTEQWRAQTGLFCASRVLFHPPRGKQPQPKVQADTLSLNIKFSLAMLLVAVRTGIICASRTLQLLWMIACHASLLLSSIVRLSCRRLRGVSVLLALCLVVVQMLLIMSGDVEENPGPPKTESDRPTMPKLLSFPSRHGNINFPQQIGANYIKFGTFLLNDESQARVAAIANQHSNDAEQINMHLLREWLQGSGTKPVTWNTLAKVLRKVPLDHLAAEIKWHCQGGSVGQTVAATEEEQPSYLPRRRRSGRLPPTASRSYIPRPMTRKGGGSVGQTVAATEEEQPSYLPRRRRSGRLLPTASRSYIPRPMTRKGVPAGGLVRPDLQTVSSKESRPHQSRHARVTPQSQRLPSTTSRELTRKEEKQGKPLVVRGQRPAFHSPIYGPVSSSPAHTAVDQYASYLRAVYTSKKLPTYSKWPPSSSKKFINLAVVRKEKVSKKEADAFTRATIHGTEIDDIYRQKEAVDFSRVGKMKDGSLAKLILVEGAPGIGKTTFAWEVCRKWASGEILQEYGLVVLLRLRDKHVREAETVFNLFYHTNPELSNAVVREILNHEGESVLLLYEGYDELPRKLQEQQSIFLDVLHKKDLPRATILITSRPSATEYLRSEFKEQISQHIEILGFTKDDIIAYVHNVIEDEQVCKDFLQYLKCYPYIRGMMYVPLNAMIVTEVYKDSQQGPKEVIPTTMTELYTALTRSLLLRYLHSHSEYGKQKWNLKYFKDLPIELHKQFCNITAVALKGMIEDTFVFNNLPNDSNTLDLMQSVTELYVAQGATVSYNFFHLTLQEYLAAVYISQQPLKKQIDYFQKSLPGISRRLRNVLRFVAGLTNFKGVPLASLQPLVLESSPRGKNMTLKSLHWLFETQCSDCYNELVSPYRLFTEYRYNIMLPFDYFVLGYAMANITSHWEIDLSDSKFGDEEIEMLVAGVNFKRVHFSQSEENRTLQQLDISSISIGDGGATPLEEMLMENRMLQQLNVSRNSIGDGGTTILVEMLKENRTLQQLDISCNSIGSRGATALAEVLKENRMLQQLNVSYNTIGDRGATAQADMLKENKMLKKLDISDNSIGDRGATALAEMLKENRTLQQLNVSSNSIGNRGAIALAKMLKENRTLQLLDVSYNSIGDGGASALAEVQKQNTTVGIDL